MLTIQDYLMGRGWQPTLEDDRHAEGFCPFHHEQTPSFHIYKASYHQQGKGHFYCFGGGCHVSGDVVKAILLSEFGGDEQCWPQAFERFKELNGAPFKPYLREGQLHPPVPREVRPLATREQQQFLSHLARIWYLHLWHEGKYADSALAYLEERGITQPVFPLGYVPSRENSAYVRHLFRVLEHEFGTSWQELGISTGLLRHDGSLRLSHRLVFSAYSKEGYVTSYQARVLPDSPPGESKFLNQPHLKKNFYVVTVPSPILPGTVLTESPFGPSLLAQHAIGGVATLGEGTHFGDLARFEQPFWLCSDNDEAGEKQAEAIAQYCREQRWEHYRIRPERATKGLDEWVNTRGVAPLIQAIQAYLPMECSA